MTALYLGIDGGATKTRAVILDETGYVRGLGIGDASNFGNTSIDQAQESIRQAVTMAASQAGVADLHFDAAFLGLAGVVSEADQNVARQIARQLNLAPVEKVGVDHDCRVALAGGLGGQPGIVQIIGTGTSCFGMTGDGKRWMASGRGYLIDDDGGGYWLGIRAMRAAVEAYDRRGEPTVLHDMVLNALGIDSIDRITERLYSAKMSVTEIATLSYVVIAAARQNDQVAMRIIAEGMKEIARSVEAVACYLGFDDEQVLVCVGGMMQAGEVITTPLKQAVHQRLPNCRIEMAMFPPSVGAGLLASQIDQIVIDKGFLETCKTSLTGRN